ncbi:uncharacterized protein DFL_002339 [Arthrobotrys flagrans]|uniref:DUF2423 domain-containing protein n=1 Tax=Arthrobotrys flagrans TaxID=97331 RepID=A0A437AA63_ARTFL|nr:hypothetical protein DFL_002339 [Arthrobotrys flagrans]
MAKSARASTKKASRSRIRNNVYAPVEQARLERLSARLMAIAQPSTSRTTSGGDHMDEDDLADATNRQEQHTEDQAFKAAQQDPASTNMDVDESSASRASTKPKSSASKVSKRTRKASSKSMVFATRKHSTKKAGKGGSKGRK